MQVKIFSGGVKKVEEQFNEWVTSSRAKVQTLSTAMLSKTVITIAVLYAEAPPQQVRTRGSERPGEAPRCSKCGRDMVVRFRRADQVPFWGCSAYPDCRNIVPFDQEDMDATKGGKEMPTKVSSDDYDGPVFGGGQYDDGDDIPF